MMRGNIDMEYINWAVAFLLIAGVFLGVMIARAKIKNRKKG